MGSKRGERVAGGERSDSKRKKNSETQERQASQLKRRDKIKEVHSLKADGYRVSQIADQLGISRRTVRRMLRINPEHMCVDGTQTRTTRKLLDPYKKQIRELVERDFQPTQILRKLQEQYPDVRIKRTTLSDYCASLRAEIFDYVKPGDGCVTTPSEGSLLSSYADKIKLLLADEKPITVIFADIKADGYSGSYSLLQQYCHAVKPAAQRTKKSLIKVKRRDLTSSVWSGNSSLTEQDLSYIEANHPVLTEIISVISEFRDAYSKKDEDTVAGWCDKYGQCQFPAIRSFINGINADSSAFYNSIKYEYSNGLLEGTVNKLKAVKRSMFGRASYLLLRAKLLLEQKL